MVSKEAFYLADKFSYLPETIERFIQLFGFDETQSMLIAYEQPQKISIRVNTLKITKEDLIERLQKKGFTINTSKLLPEGLIIEHAPFPIGATTEYLLGYYFLQSSASWVPVLALEPHPFETIIDFTAAPGGKSTHIAQEMQNKGVLICLDISRERMKALRSNLSRCAVKHVISIRMDARKFPIYKFKADKILLDAPCTGEGLMAIDKTRRTMRTFTDIQELKILQQELLASALKSLKKNGVIVYSTCSTAPEENEEVIDWGLKNYPIEILDLNVGNFDQGIVTAFGKAFHPEVTKARRLLPHKHGTEGFFVCKMRLLQEVG